MPTGTQPGTHCLTITDCLAHHCSPDISSHSVQQRRRYRCCYRFKQTAGFHTAGFSALLRPAWSHGCPRKTADVQLAGPPQPGHWCGLQPKKCCWICSIRCCSLQAFSLQALRSLAAGVGCHHGSLAVLNLSGVLLHDEGMKVLAQGIHKCVAAVHMLS